MTLARSEIVAPQPSDATALAIAERIKQRTLVLFDPTAGGAFDHGTTTVSTAIPPLVVLGLTTSVTSGNLIVATTTLEDRVNVLDKLINRVVYTLEANGLTS